MKLLAAAAFLMGIALHAQVPELDRLVGKDLRQEPADSLRRLNEMLGEIPPGVGFSPSAPRPWHVWKITHDGQVRYVVFMGEPIFSFPGESSARIQLLDSAGRRMEGRSFPTGFGYSLLDASTEFSRDLKSDLVVLQMGPNKIGRHDAKQYFAIGHDRLRLVRLENDRGEAAQNDYVSSSVDLVPDAKSADQFASLLESNDKADVLSALVFLGGRHLDERKFGLGDSKYAALFQEVIGNLHIQTLIERLTGSDDEWIKQAAKLAARGPRERPLY